MGGLTSPKGGDTKTTTQVNTVPSYVSDAQQNLYGSAANILGPFLQTPNYTTAGVNADQTGAYDLTRSLAQDAFTAPNYGANLNTPGYVPATLGPAAGYTTTSMGPAAQYDAKTVNGADIQALMNPYTQSVIDPTLANMRRQSDINAAQIGAQSAASGSFGGSREAIRQAQNTRSLGEQTAQLVPQLYSQSYNTAAGLAQANAAAQNSAAAQNASARQSAAQFDAGANNTASQYGAGAINAARQFDAGAYNTAAQFNANRSMQAAQMMDALASSDQTRKMQAISALLGIGNSQQQMVQTNLNTPLQYLQALAGIVPQNTGGTQTTTAPNTAPSPLQTLLGIGTGILGMGVTGGGSLGGNLISGAFK